MARIATLKCTWLPLLLDHIYFKEAEMHLKCIWKQVCNQSCLFHANDDWKVNRKVQTGWKVIFQVWAGFSSSPSQADLKCTLRKVYLEHTWDCCVNQPILLIGLIPLFELFSMISIHIMGWQVFEICRKPLRFRSVTLRCTVLSHNFVSKGLETIFYYRFFFSDTFGRTRFSIFLMQQVFKLFGAIVETVENLHARPNRRKS